jgi:acyl-CoA synthetase (AMP-forming)/AMP-acid ligase II
MQSAIRPVAQALARWAAETPQAQALSDAGGALTYGEFDHNVAAVAAWLGEQGVLPGERIFVVGENSMALACLIFAAARAGVTAVLENARRAPAETDMVLAHCAPKLVIFLFGNSESAKQHAARHGAKAAQFAPLGEFALLRGSGADDGVDEKTNDERVAVIIYTTGTTGKPKGVMLPQRALDFISSRMQELRFVTPKDSVYGVLPITHVMGLASVLSGALASGARLHLVARFSAEHCVDYIREHGVTMLQGAPAMFAKIVDHCHARGINRLEGVRFTGSGGAPIDPAIKREAERLFGVPLHNGYGLTEGASIAWTRFEDNDRDDTVGRALPGVELRIDKKAPDDEVGELWARGPNVMTGYFRDPARTAEVLTADGWFNTQDLARIAPDGRVYIVGRTKDIIIRSGFNVYPLEVELALGTHPDVLHCAVIGRPVKGNEEVVAFVELAHGARATADELKAYLAERLSPYKRPSEIVIMDSLPTAANGKVLKSALALPPQA